MLWIKTFINIKSIKKDRVIENNLLHEHSLFLRGCFRVQRNLFSYLWNLKTLILAANLRKDQQISAIWEPQNVCLPECKKKVPELWDPVSIYRGWKTLKNRHRWLKCEFKPNLLRKGQKGMHYHHPKSIGPKPKKGKFSPFKVPFSTPKVPNGALGHRTFFCVRVRFGLSF